MAGNAESSRWKLWHRRQVLDPASGRVILKRWTLLEVPLFGIKVHHIVQSDPIARGYHTHPWTFLSVRLRGRYREHLLVDTDQILVQRISMRRADVPHRVELIDGRACWTLILTGRRKQTWGFLKIEEETSGN